MPALWFTPVCDTLLQTVAHWLATYERGEVYASRKWLGRDGVVDRPTCYAHRLAFRPNELQHLLNILTHLTPKSEVLADIGELQAGLRRGRLLPGGKYVVTVAFYKQDIQEIYDALVRARAGETAPLDAPKSDGKELFEV